MGKARVSRRKFGMGAVAATFAAGGKMAAGTPQAEPPDVTPEQAAEVEARLGEAVRRYGDRLSDAQRQRLRRVLTQNARMLSIIRSFPLENGDTPATTVKLSIEKAGGNQSCPKVTEHAR